MEIRSRARRMQQTQGGLSLLVIDYLQLKRSGSSHRAENRQQEVSDMSRNLLLNREDAHDRASPRSGEADLILAKHRNGPTTTITVGFQGHYSRFVDMGSESVRGSAEVGPKAAHV